MEPNFSRSFLANIKKWKPSEIEEGEFDSTTEVITIIADDLIQACYKAHDYISCVKANSEWKTGEVIGITLECEVLLGTKEIVPQTGILTGGVKYYPCCHE